LNDQTAFLELIESACSSAYLCNGDILIVDNASIHDAEDTAELLEDVLNTYGVKLVFLPAYSPELNPCELVFGLTKAKIRDVLEDQPIFDVVIESFAEITHETMTNFYSKCLFPRTILPELIR